MNQSKTTDIIVSLAQEYNNKSFIAKDPISFPHRFTEKKDIEISSLVSSWIAYGNRKAILQTLNTLHQDFEKVSNSPFSFIKNRDFAQYKDNNTCLYRFYKWNDYYNLCQRLYEIYIEQGFASLEDKLDCMISKPENTATFSDVLLALINIFSGITGIPKDDSSACKRLCMLLRWLVRDDKIVDFGIWHILSPKDLVIPLDTHVFQMSKTLELTQRNTASMATAMEITQSLKTIFPQDPTKADFALFGYGVANDNKI